MHKTTEFANCEISSFTNMRYTKLLTPSPTVARPGKSRFTFRHSLALELKEPILVDITSEELDLLRTMTNTTAALIWLTGANPWMELHQICLWGLPRALILEQPSLRFAILDIRFRSHISKTYRTGICSDIEKLLFSDDLPDDKGFILKNGLHTSVALCPMPA